MRIKLDKIQISKEFKTHPPRTEKMFNKLLYYVQHKKFDSKIILDENNVLIDGYTTYLLAIKLGKKYIKARKWKPTWLY